MSKRRDSGNTPGRWIEPIPQAAHAGWCLPAFGGRVLIRGYDTHRSRLQELEYPRWGLDETLVPLSSEAAEKTTGPAGAVYPGDCVVFVGSSSASPTPFVWFPQRIIHVEEGPSGWQRVWAVRDLDRDNDERPAIEPRRIPRRLLSDEPLHDRDRRMILEWFGLNLDCEHCASRGGHIWFGPIIDPMPPWPYGGVTPRPGDDTYWCACGARWHVRDDGQLVLSRPRPIM